MSQKYIFRGSIPAVVTPMHKDGSVDIDLFLKLLDWHVAEGSNGVVVAGTTGEAPTLSTEEQIHLIEIACKHLAGRIPVIAGTGANSTAEAIELAIQSKRVGANAQLSVVPYYNKPSQQGIYAHFKAIAEACELPIILYNVPGRTVADIHNNTVLELANIKNIIGIKDATGDMGRGFDLLCRRPKDFLVLSGDDITALALTLLGGDGVISVTANAYPKIMSQMMADAIAGRHHLAISHNAQLQKLHNALFIEPNPAPLKWIMAYQNKLQNNLRLPLVPISTINEAKLVELIKNIK